VNGPGFVQAALCGDDLEAGSCEPVIVGTVDITRGRCGPLRGAQGFVVALKSPVGLVLGRRDTADQPQQPVVVPPVHPPAGGQLNVFNGAPWPLAGTVDDFGLVHPDLGRRAPTSV
jgi:hypothetical protein